MRIELGSGSVARSIARALARVIAIAAPLVALEPGAGSPEDAGTSGPARERPDVLVFMLDDVGVDDLAAVAHHAPTIGALAKRGLTLTACYGAPVCSPARRMFHYLEWYTRQSAEQPGQEPPRDAVSLAERLPGYATLMLGKWHLGPSLPSLVGCEPPAQGWTAFRAGIAKLPHPSYDAWDGYEDCAQRFSLSYVPAAQTAAFAQWWPATPAPRFALYATALAHLDGTGQYHRPPNGWLTPGYPPTPTPRAKYEAMIVAADRQLERALRHVDLERTIVVVVGENGTPGELMPDVTGDGVPDPDRGKGSVYERGLRIPCILAGPGIAQGESDALCSILDVSATLVELCTGRAPAGDGRSLRALLAEPRAPGPRTYLLAGVEGDPRWPDQLAVRHRRWKYHLVDGVERLFDLAHDPAELVDVAADPRRAKALAGCRLFLAQNRP